MGWKVGGGGAGRRERETVSSKACFQVILCPYAFLYVSVLICLSSYVFGPL